MKIPFLYVSIGMFFFSQAVAIAKLCWSLSQCQEERLKGDVSYELKKSEVQKGSRFFP